MKDVEGRQYIEFSVGLAKVRACQVIGCGCMCGDKPEGSRYLCDRTYEKYEHEMIEDKSAPS